MHPVGFIVIAVGTCIDLLCACGMILVDGAIFLYEECLKDAVPGIIIPEQRIYGSGNMSIEKDEVKGKGKQIKGQIREEVGKLTDNKTEQLKGKIEQVEGKVQEEIGKLKRKAKE